jgi:hypothetical protein
MKFKKKKNYFEISDEENLMYIRTHLKLLFNDLTDVEPLKIDKKPLKTNNDFINDEIDKNKPRIILRKKKNLAKEIIIPHTLE